MKRAVCAFTVLVILMLAVLPAAAGVDGPRIPTPTALDLKPYAGRVVYVDFWASWCKPCRLSFPWLRELQAKYGEQGLTVLLVNEDHDRKAAEAFLAELGEGLTNIWDDDFKLGTSYEPQGLPAGFLIGRDGRLRVRHVGFDPKNTAEIDGEVRALLAEGAPDEVKN